MKLIYKGKTVILKDVSYYLYVKSFGKFICHSEICKNFREGVILNCLNSGPTHINGFPNGICSDFRPTEYNLSKKE